jgi:hypothetical protein
MRLSVLVCDLCGREEKHLAVLGRGKMDLCGDCLITIANDLLDALPTEKRDVYIQRAEDGRKAIVLERCGPQC